MCYARHPAALPVVHPRIPTIPDQQGERRRSPCFPDQIPWQRRPEQCIREVGIPRDQRDSPHGKGGSSEERVVRACQDSRQPQALRLDHLHGDLLAVLWQWSCVILSIVCSEDHWYY
jgi:hypothetical protein